MVIVEELVNEIKDELKDAKKYIKRATQCKEKRPNLAAAYYKLSLEELGHANVLHEQVVAIIEEYRSKNGDPPADMMARYNYLHAIYITKANKIKLMQSLYKS